MVELFVMLMMTLFDLLPTHGCNRVDTYESYGEC